MNFIKFHAGAFRRCAAIAMLFGSIAAYAAIPVTGKSGASLESLVDSETLVTVILKSSLARDVNLTVAAIEEHLVRFNDERGNSIVYPREVIREVRVQTARVDNPFSNLDSAFQSDDQIASRIKKQAGEKAAEIFQTSAAQPALQIAAAFVGAAMGDLPAREYLEQSMLSANPDVAIFAAGLVDALGDPVPATVLQDGMRTGARETRGRAATMAGKSGYRELEADVLRLVRDPDPLVFRGAAIGIGYYGNEQALPYLLRALNSADESKANAAVWALVKIGGEQVTREARTRVETATGPEWYRSVDVLYELDDPVGRELMRTECFNHPLFATEAALTLIQDDFWDANVYLRRFIENTSESNPAAHKKRAAAAVMLHARGYVQARATLRDIFTMAPSQVYIRGSLGDNMALLEALTEIQATTCDMITIEGDAGLLPLLETVMDGNNPFVTIAAAIATIGVTDPDIRENLRLDL